MTSVAIVRKFGIHLISPSHQEWLLSSGGDESDAKCFIVGFNFLFGSKNNSLLQKIVEISDRDDIPIQINSTLARNKNVRTQVIEFEFKKIATETSLIRMSSRHASDW
jgi:FAD synthase